MTHRWLALVLLVASSLATRGAAAEPEPSSELEAIQKQVAASGVLDVLGEYGPLEPNQVRYLLLVDRPSGKPDLAATADGKLWIVEGRTARPATDRDLIGKASRQAILERLPTIEKYSVAVVLRRARVVASR